MSTTATEGLLKVLLVDDHESSLLSMEAILSEDCHVTVATNGAEALAAIANGDFDVVCTDYKMPGMTGVELLLRARDAGAVFGAILVTGMRAYVHEELRDSCPDLNFGVLLKPYKPERLLEAVVQAATIGKMRKAVRMAMRASSSEASK